MTEYEDVPCASSEEVHLMHSSTCAAYMNMFRNQYTKLYGKGKISFQTLQKMAVPHGLRGESAAAEAVQLMQLPGPGEKIREPRLLAVNMCFCRVRFV